MGSRVLIGWRIFLPFAAASPSEGLPYVRLDEEPSTGWPVICQRYPIAAPRWTSVHASGPLLLVTAGRDFLSRWRGSATLERLRSVDGLVALYVVNHLAEHVADAALAIGNPSESLYRRLQERTGVEPFGGGRTLEAIAAPDWLAELLELSPGAPVAFIESVARDADMRPFDCYHAWLRTDRTRIDIQVSGPQAATSHPLAAGRETTTQ